MRLSDYKGEKAIEVIADLIVPCTEILSDPEIRKSFESDTRMILVKKILKLHGKSILEIMAILDGEDVETYSPSLVEIPKKLLKILNDPDVASLFMSQAQSNESANSGSASENTLA